MQFLGEKINVDKVIDTKRQILHAKLFFVKCIFKHRSKVAIEKRTLTSKVDAFYRKNAHHTIFICEIV